MPADSIEGVLKKFFSHSSPSDWKKMAMEETKGEDPFEILSWRGKDGILFLPYYHAQDVAHLSFLNRFQTPATENSFSGPKSWINLPAINIADEVNANSLALEHLSSGADGILFDFPRGENADPHKLLQNIQWPYCFLAFQFSDERFSAALADFIRSQPNPASVNGALFWESIPKRNTLEFYFEHCTNLKSLGLIIPSASPAAEISHALVHAVKTFEKFSTGSDAGKILRSIAFSLSADPCILETIAKFKALRMLWVQVAHAYGIHDYKGSELHIHTRSLAVADHYYAPHENMLKGTYAAIAAILGGCNSLTVMSAQQSASALRWARNVSSILKEESFFSSVADPVAGSYAIDTMVDKIARRAWEDFQMKTSEV